MSGILNICRICVNKTEYQNEMQPLFEENNLRCTEILKQIEECTGISLQPKAAYPKMMCKMCLDALNKSLQFRTLCQSSENALLQILMQEPKLEPQDNVEITNNELLNFCTEFVETELIVGVEEVVEPPPTPTTPPRPRTPKREKRKVTLVNLIDYSNDNDNKSVSGVDVSAGVANAVGVGVTSTERIVDDDGNITDETEFNDNADMDFEATSSDDTEYSINNKKKHLFYKKKKKSKTTSNLLIQHKKSKKRGRPRLKDLNSTTNGQINAPIKRVRGRKKMDVADFNIMCEICGNIYTKRSLLNMHMRRHLDVKPFECEICGKTFTCPSAISRHIRVHTGEKPYVCNYCGRAFADRSSNIKHERIHTNTRPFICKTCGKSFTYSNVLKNHMLTHTGEKPFPCLPCNKTFSRKHQLEQHCATNTHKQKMQNVEYFVVKMEDDHLVDNEFAENNVENILMAQNPLLETKPNFPIKDEQNVQKIEF